MRKIKEKKRAKAIGAAVEEAAPLKLYVWSSALTDVSDGVMFALARNVREARKLILAECKLVPLSEFKQKPKVYRTPIGFAVWGGG